MTKTFFSALLLLFTLPLANAQYLGVTHRIIIRQPTVTYANNGCHNNTNGVGSLTCSISNVVQGQTILVSAAQFNATTVSLTDSNTGTVEHILGTTNYNGGSGFSDVWVVKNAGAGVHVLTATYSSGSTGYPSIIADVINGASLTDPIDNASASDPSGYATTCADVTTTSPNELLISFAHNSGPTLTPGGTPQPMTVAQVVGDNDLSAYGRASAAGTTRVEWIHAGASTDVACDTIALH
jgi:hypothetical protein